jgi:hypothetical protein
VRSAPLRLLALPQIQLAGALPQNPHGQSQADCQRRGGNVPDSTAPKWAKELRKGLMAEIAAMEAGGRKVLEVEGRTSTDVSDQALERLRLRLKQVEKLIASFEG